MAASTQGTTNSSLIRDAKLGSARALDELFDQVAPRVLATIRLILGPSMRPQIESQDVLQVTLLKAFLNLEQFEGSQGGSLFGWLGAIARNEIRDQIEYLGRQKRDRNRQVSIETEFPEIADRIRSEVSRLHLQARELELELALERLKPEHREILILRRFEELTFPEIAALMQRTPDACRMLYARAFAALVREVGDAV